MLSQNMIHTLQDASPHINIAENNNNNPDNQQHQKTILTTGGDSLSARLQLIADKK